MPKSSRLSDFSGLLVSSRTSGDPEVLEHLGRGAVVARVGRQSEVEVGVDGVAAGVLERVGLQLGDQTDPAALVAAQVDHHAASGGHDAGERLVELRTAVAALRAEHVTGQALRVHPGQHRLPSPAPVEVSSHQVAVHQGDVLGVVDGRVVAVRREVAVPGRQPGLRDPLDQGLGAVSVAHQVVDRDHRQPVLVGELAQLGRALHGAVVVDHLDQHARRREAGQPSQVDGRLGVAASHQHAALAVAQREHVPRPGQLPRLGGRVGQHPGGVRAVGRADAGRDAVAGVDRDRVRRTHPVAVVRRHQRDLEPVEHGGRHRHADHAAAVPDRERHQLRRRLGGREDQVALVLAVHVVDDHDRLAGGDVGDRALDAVQPDAHVDSPAVSCRLELDDVAVSVRLARSHTTKPQITRAP